MATVDVEELLRSVWDQHVLHPTAIWIDDVFLERYSYRSYMPRPTAYATPLLNALFQRL